MADKKVCQIFTKEKYQYHRNYAVSQNHNLCTAHTLSYTVYFSSSPVLSHISCNRCTEGHEYCADYILNLCCRGEASHIIFPVNIYSTLYNNCSDRCNRNCNAIGTPRAINFPQAGRENLKFSFLRCRIGTSSRYI